VVAVVVPPVELLAVAQTVVAMEQITIRQQQAQRPTQVRVAAAVVMPDFPAALAALAVPA
jgi:hypothetical protein